MQRGTKTYVILTPTTLALFVLCASKVLAQDVNPYYEVHLTPIEDTYATHNEHVVHGSEPVIRVGIEPQECEPDGWDPCPDDDMECCVLEDDINYCSPPGQCPASEPYYPAFRKWRGYIRFDLTDVPEGKVVSASLRLTEVNRLEKYGGSPHIEVYRLNEIGEEHICEWQEETLDNTNLTTWSSLPQNVSISEGLWVFDVTKAVRDWLNGDTDYPDEPIQPNCGFHLADPDFGTPEEPLWRWVEFSSKEGQYPPMLAIVVALDLDGDGYYADCDETDPAINPGATEECNMIDDDCDGLTDEENCDGIDNDCDGLTDEPDPDESALCPAGMTCIYHQCIVTCEDECAGPFDLKCELNEEGIWETYGCGNVDDDPCLEWYKAETCEPDEYCEFGFCSNNCIDLCNPEEEGKWSCQQDSLGKWYLMQCGDWDGDGCLEWGNAQYCGPGATCQQSQCSEPCSDECPSLGLVECTQDNQIRACWDSDNDGCLEWNIVDQCKPGFQCINGDCYPECQNECEPDSTLCKVEQDGAWLYVCQKNQSGCYVWQKVEQCECGCAEDNESCLTPCPPQPEPTELADLPDLVDQADIIEQETPDIQQDLQPEPNAEVVESDAALQDTDFVDSSSLVPDTAAIDAKEQVSSDVSKDQAVSADETVVEPESSGGGCNCSMSASKPSFGSIFWTLILALLLGWLRFFRPKSSDLKE